MKIIRLNTQRETEKLIAKKNQTENLDLFD